MPFPPTPNPGDEYTDEYGTVWVYAGEINSWYRKTVIPGNETEYTSADLYNPGGGAVGEVLTKTADGHEWAAGGGGSPFPLGSAAAPSISFEGDTNTGIYSPGADQLALSTNGTGRLFVDANGNVGFGGLPSPERSIHLPDGGVLLLGTTADTGTQIAHSASNNFTINNKEAGAQIFYTNNAERLRIDSSGRLLVGTSSDSGGALLQVNGNRIRVATAKTPASASDTGTTGEICWDASYIYVCTATNTWKRAALSTW